MQAWDSRLECWVPPRRVRGAQTALGCERARQLASDASCEPAASFSAVSLESPGPFDLADVWDDRAVRHQDWCGGTTGRNA
eukprot:3482599-Prymnesium_polylepis.1